MEIGMMIVFLTLDLFLAGICWAITSRRDTYERGMLLGVHIPPAVSYTHLDVYKRQEDGKTG